MLIYRTEVLKRLYWYNFFHISIEKYSDEALVNNRGKIVFIISNVLVAEFAKCHITFPYNQRWCVYDLKLHDLSDQHRQMIMFQYPYYNHELINQSESNQPINHLNCFSLSVCNKFTALKKEKIRGPVSYLQYMHFKTDIWILKNNSQ